MIMILKIKYFYQVKKKVSMSKVELFELFFSEEVKNCIIEVSMENNLELTHDKLPTFFLLHYHLYAKKRKI